MIGHNIGVILATMSVFSKEVEMSKCPHCKKESISVLERLTTGAVFSKTCCECHKKWGISYISVLWLLVPIIVNHTDLGINQTITKLVSIGVMLIGLIYLTPVVKR